MKANLNFLRRNFRKKLLVAIPGALLLAACAVTPITREPFDYSQLYKDLADHIIMPNLQRLSENGKTLAQSLEELCDAPGEQNLSVARENWKRTQAILKRLEPFNIGPYMTEQFEALLDFWPARTQTIEEKITSEENFSPELLNSLGVSLRGLPAIEYLLFSPTESGEALELLTGPEGSKRCSLLVAQGIDLQDNTESLQKSWSSEGKDYYSQFIHAGENSESFPMTQDLIDKLINQLSNFCEYAKDNKLGAPLGLKSGGLARPELVESPFSQESIANLSNNIAGIQAFFSGESEYGTGMGLQSLITYHDPSTAEKLKEQLETARLALLAIQIPLDEAVLDVPSKVETAYNAIRNLRDTLKVTVSAQLGVVTVFSDNDGD